VASAKLEADAIKVRIDLLEQYLSAREALGRRDVAVNRLETQVAKLTVKLQQ
jgi:L-rhamnose isomerase